jgi:hypothetical protein
MSFIFLIFIQFAQDDLNMEERISISSKFNNGESRALIYTDFCPEDLMITILY